MMVNEMRDAQILDIYVDENGALWRCIATCPEPTVTFEVVEGRTLPPPSLNQMGMAQQNTYSPPAPAIIKDRKNGGVSGAMWNGWKRIYRPDDDSRL